MVGASKKNQKVDLERIAAQLAKVHITPVAGTDHHALRATATFTTRSFVAGNYKVSVGVRQALLHLEHPGYDIEHAYQATLAKETWSENWKSSNTTHLGGQIKVTIGAKLWQAIGFSAKAQAEKDRHESAESKASAPYPIVTTSPGGWQIGTELGDPRDPQGTLPDGLEHCLNGEYLSGRNGEHGDGYKEKNGRIALCELINKTGGNDPHITATLFGSSSSLKIAIARSETSATMPETLASRSEQKDHEDALRKAFIEICIQRAKDAAEGGARTDVMVSGEFYLSHHQVHGPRTPSNASVTLKSIQGEQASAAKPKA